MKKYDLILLALYLLPVIILTVTLQAVIKPVFKARFEAKEYFQNLYQQSVNQVVIRDVNFPLEVRGKELLRHHKRFNFVGNLSVKDVACFQVSGDTLYIQGKNGHGQTDLVLYKADDVQVDTINAPKVTFSTMNRQN